MRLMAHQKIGVKVVLIACLAVALCMMPCGVAEHHARMGTPSISCTVDLPHLFQLPIMVNMLLLGVAALIMVPQDPAFPLLKPPRFAFF